MSSHPKACVVVDPYSSGRYLLYELKERGIPIICVRSSLKLGAFFLNSYATHKDYYSATVDFNDLQSCLMTIKDLPFEVIAVFAGSEPGVSVADMLAEALNLPCRNDTALSDARKDKAEMQDQLRRKGVPACKQILSGDLEEIMQWAREGDSWPLVVKPCSSSGSDGVFFCKGEEDLVQAYNDLIGQVTPNGTTNDQIVLQEFLNGTEYIVDTVSYQGQHLCCAIWVYTKRKGTPWNPTCIISEGNELMQPTGDVQEVLIDYVFKVLDAVGLAYGPCHTEIMMTARGPILVEVNARLHGLQGPHLIGMATGTSKATYAVDALAGGGTLFEKHYHAGPGRWLYPVNKHVLQFVLISPTQGYIIRSIANNIYSLNLPSVVKVLPAVPKGKWLNQSCDLNTAAGYVLMVHESSDQIRADAKVIRQAEDDGEIYQVTLESPLGTPEQSPSLSPALPPVSCPGSGTMSMPGMPGTSPMPSMSPMPQLGSLGMSPMPNSSFGINNSFGGASSFGSNPGGFMPGTSPGAAMISQSPKLRSMEGAGGAWAASGFSLTGGADDLLGTVPEPGLAGEENTEAQ